MSKYRDIISATAIHEKNEYAGALSRLLRLFAIPLVVWVWLASVTVNVLSLVAVIGDVATRHQYETQWTDWASIGLLAVLLVVFSILNREIRETASWIWNQVEDAFGRVAVFVYNITRISISDENRHLRKVVAWLAAFAGLAVLFFSLRLTFSYIPPFEVKGNSLATLVNTMGRSDALIFALGALFSGVVGALIWRFSFSGKWTWVFSQPQCVISSRAEERAIFPKDNLVKIVHASDLHITDSPAATTVEGKHLISQQTLTAVLAAIAEDAADCSAVLLTGDITDAGTSGAWKRLLDAVPAEIRDKLILLPGNHDLNLQDRFLVRRAERLDSFGRRMRQVRMMCAMAEIMGDRAILIDRKNNRLV
ncbi:metallophosphoesterase family protein, partial [Cupriavidus pauculus]|uniref:metallophosphoesterase family protein n=1 Tax=Cupriavidus pauculus TaxID=82633 RepID=UPI00190FD65A